MPLCLISLLTIAMHGAVRFANTTKAPGFTASGREAMLDGWNVVERIMCFYVIHLNLNSVFSIGTIIQILDAIHSTAALAMNASNSTVTEQEAMTDGENSL